MNCMSIVDFLRVLASICLGSGALVSLSKRDTIDANGVAFIPPLTDRVRTDGC